MPKVSVIIPVYGVEKYIERCARSLFEQTLDDIEFIFVDDCTPDRSIEILESIIEKYRLRLTAEKKTVRIERMPTNSGLAAVRRHGIQLATGDYIIHCDSDDWVDVDMYRMMYEKAIEDNAEVVVCDFCTHNGDNVMANICGCASNSSSFFLKELFFQKKDWSVWNKLVKHSIYDQIEYFPTGAMGEDMVITLQIIYFCKNLSYINLPLYFYFYNDNSIMHQKNKDALIKKTKQIIENFSLIDTFFREKPDYNNWKRGLDTIASGIKSKLYINDESIINIRRNFNRGVELRVLLYPEVSFARKRKIFNRLFVAFLLNR